MISKMLWEKKQYTEHCVWFTICIYQKPRGGREGEIRIYSHNLGNMHKKLIKVGGENWGVWGCQVFVRLAKTQKIHLSQEATGRYAPINQKG